MNTPRSRLSILFVAHLGDLKGGADKMLLVLIKNLDRQQFDSIVLCPWRGSQELQHELGKVGIPVISWHYNSWINFHHYLPRKLYRLLSNLFAALLLAVRFRGKIDVVYTNSLYSPLGAMVAMLLRVPHVWHAHESIEEGIGATYDWGRSFSMRVLNNMSKQIICSSYAVQQALSSFASSQKLHMVYPGILNQQEAATESRRTKRIQNSDLHLCTVGRISQLKGQADAVQAVARLNQEGYEAYLHLAGAGAEQEETSLRQTILDLGVDRRIIWHGFTDPYAVFRQSDICLVCSRHEGFGLVVVEAMAAGCPMIATNVGAIPELIGNNERGLLYTPGNIDELVDRIKYLAQNAEVYERLADIAWDFAYRHFTIQRYTQQIQQIVRDAASSQDASRL